MKKKVREALDILAAIRMPKAQLNERSALCLLAICNLAPRSPWAAASQLLIGVTPIMEFVAQHYREQPYAPNTRETIRRQTLHQFMQAGVCAYNPDKPGRPVNSPAAVYQLTQEMLTLVRKYGTSEWPAELDSFKSRQTSLAEQYAMPRQMLAVPLCLPTGQEIHLSPGLHSELIRQIVEVFGPRFAPGGQLVYVGDSGEKWGYFNESLLTQLNVKVRHHGKMPDVMIYWKNKNWLLLCESVTSHGPVDSKRHQELKNLFSSSSAGLVFVTAFPSRSDMARHLSTISWETEVWCAEAPTHLIHFNGERFLGPYAS